MQRRQSARRSGNVGNSGYRGIAASARATIRHGIEGRNDRSTTGTPVRRMEVQPDGSRIVDAAYVTRQYLRNVQRLPEGNPEEFYIGVLDDATIKSITKGRIVRSSKIDETIEDGINSLMMGYHGTGGYVCSTCQVSGNCYGHPGRIELAAPIPNPAHMDKIMNCVQCTCRNCGQIFVDVSAFMSINQNNGKSLLVNIWEASTKEIRACVHCQQHPRNIEVMKKNSIKFCQIVYTKIKTSEESKREKEARAKEKKEQQANRDEGDVVEEAKPAKKKTHYLMEGNVLRRILDRVHPNALQILHIAIQPANMMMKYLLVIPPIVRPSVEIDGQVKPHPLTSGYKVVIEKNHALHKVKSSDTRLTQISAYSDLVTAVNYLIMGGKSSSNHAKNKLRVSVEEFANVSVDVEYDALSDTMKKQLEERSILPTKRGTVSVTSLVASGRTAVNEMDIQVVTAKNRNSRIDPNSSINGMLKTKHGEIIGRVLAKRCTGGKAVLSIGHYLEFGQIGIPRLLANEFSLPMTVTAQNYNLIQSLREPTEHYPRGRIKKIKKRGANVAVTLHSQSIEVGDEVERVIMDGDIVIFNRFPIIWRHSMSAYTVVLHDHLTIDLHQAALDQHHADFDGDTGVVRFPQSELARRAAGLMHIRKNLVSASSGGSVAGLIMDASLGAYFMTSRNEKMSEDQFRHHLMAVHNDVDKVDELVEEIRRRVDYINTRIIGLRIETFTTSTLYSTSLPAGFNYEHGGAIIVNGIVAYGTLHSPHLGTGQHSITRHMSASHGDMAVSDYLTYSNWITVEWLNYHGLTIGIGDVWIQDEEFNQSVNQVVEDNIRNYYITNLRGRLGKENPYDTERKSWSILESIQGLIANLFIAYCEKNGSTNNSLYHLIKSGKISKEIASQMIGVVGVVSYFGKFCPETEGRCTIYGLRRSANDIRDPRELGFIQSSYSKGVSPLEAFIGFRAAMGGAVSTNCATADFGHIYNLLNAVLTSCYITKGMVVQYMGSTPKIIMAHSDVRGIDTEKTLINKRKEFGLGNLQNLADSINFRLG